MGDELLLQDTRVPYPPMAEAEIHAGGEALATHRALLRIDREFYLRNADEFDRTRGAPWEGWSPVADWARGRRLGGGGLRVLDLGCGNGRFGAFLESRLDSAPEVLGVDSSIALLARARAAARGARRRSRWLALDLVEGTGASALLGRYDLVVAFGLMHHVPGHRRRARLLHDVGELLDPRGRLAISFWQFADDPRFERRLVDARARLEAMGEPTEGLEPGDHLLRWGLLSAPEGPVRYCHHTSDDEADRLATASGLRVAERYHADGRTGRLNLYLALER